MTRANVLVRLEQYQIDLGREEAAEGDGSGDVDAHAHARDLNLQRRQLSARLYMLTQKNAYEVRVYMCEYIIRACKLAMCGTDLVIIVSAEVDGHKGQPDDARRIHSKADVFGFVKVLRDLTSLERVQGAH